MRILDEDYMSVTNCQRIRKQDKGEMKTEKTQNPLFFNNNKELSDFSFHPSGSWLLLQPFPTSHHSNRLNICNLMFKKRANVSKKRGKEKENILVETKKKLDKRNGTCYIDNKKQKKGGDKHDKIS
jgi:hypothetical protein